MFTKLRQLQIRAYVDWREWAIPLSIRFPYSYYSLAVITIGPIEFDIYRR